MAGDAEIWRRITERDGLAGPKLRRLASSWRANANLARPIEVVADISKSQRLGFTAYQAFDDSVFDLFSRLRAH